MFRPFADPLLVAAECRPRPQAVPLKLFAFTTPFPISRQRRGQTNRVPRGIGRTVHAQSIPAAKRRQAQCPVAKQQPLWPVRYGVAHLLSRAATSMIDRGRRLTDEAFRTRFGKLSAGSSGCLFHVFAPVALRSFAAGLKSARPSVSGRFLGRDPNRSWATIQVIFCVPEMCETHDRALARSARGTSDRSGRGLSTASPAAEKSAATAPA